MRPMWQLRGPVNRPASNIKTWLDLNGLDERVVPDGTALDLASAGACASAGDVYFKQYDAQPTGTGHIDSFLRVQAAGANGQPQQGYNTDARPLEFNENKSPNFTRGLPLSEVPKVTWGSGVYREFLLDINQKSSQPYLSLDELRLFVGGSGDLHGYAGGELNGATRIYDLDASENKWLRFDYRLNSGSGSGDMLMYVPDSWFNGGSHVYLFSRFGDNFAGNAGFQEWAVGEGAVTAVANIAGTVFHDANRDGVRSDGEALLPDRIVFIDTNGNEERDSDEAYQITSAAGTFLFENVAVGTTYTLHTSSETLVGQETTTPQTATPILGQTVSVDIPVVRPAS